MSRLPSTSCWVKITILFKKKNLNILKYPSKDSSPSDGAAILVIATTTTGCIICGSSIGEKGKKAEDIGLDAAKSLCDDIEIGCCVDRYLQDQLIIFMALAKGTSKIKTGPLTEHTKTSIHYSQLLTGAQFTVTKAPGAYKQNTFWIECTGIAFKNTFL